MLEHGKSIIDYGVKLLPGSLVVSPWRNVLPKIYTENYHLKKEALFIECQRKKQSHFGILQRFRAIDIAKLIEICVNASSRGKKDSPEWRQSNTVALHSLPSHKVSRNTKTNDNKKHTEMKASWPFIQRFTIFIQPIRCRGRNRVFPNMKPKQWQSR